MLAGHSHQLLEKAAIESLRRVRQDRERAPQRIKPLLAYIEENLFDPTLDVNQLKRSCGVRDNSVPIQFHSAVGRPPHGYIEDRRLETACRLLGESNLKIWQISELLGYSSIQVFSRAFSRWSGQRPTSYRKKARQQAQATGKNGSPGRNLLTQGTESLRRALAGELSAEEASQLIAQLQQIYPNVGSASEPFDASHDPEGGGGVAASISGNYSGLDLANEVPLWGSRPPQTTILKLEELDRLQAERVWRELEKEPLERQHALIDGLTLKTPTLFHFLRAKSRELARKDARRGVEVADLALRSLERLRFGKRSLDQLKGQGWIFLANARRLAGDYLGAEQGFETAERFLQRSAPNPAMDAEKAIFKAGLRCNQRRFTEARELLDLVLRFYRRYGSNDDICAILIMQATERYEEGEPAAAIPFLEEAVQLTDRNTPGMTLFSLYHNLVTAYSEAGRHAEAIRLLPTVRGLCETHGEGYDRIRFRWLEGMVSRDTGQFEEAEKALIEARDAFSEIEDATDAALVCLDLASLYCKQGRAADLQNLAASMAPIFGALQHYREAWAALQLFHRAVEDRSVTSLILERARKALQSTR